VFDVPSCGNGRARPTPRDTGPLLPSRGDNRVSCVGNVGCRASPGTTTTVFDGTYAGVSRESTWIARYGTAPTSASPGTPGNDAKCGQNGVPFPLTIMNGVVRSTPDYWEGTVTPQGSLVIRNGTRQLRAQIDNQGIIRGQRSGIDCATTWVWRRQFG
jgi:hypothetical protein